MYQTETRIITNPGLWAKEIIKEMNAGRLSEEEGKKGLFKLLMLVCDAREKE